MPRRGPGISVSGAGVALAAWVLERAGVKLPTWLLIPVGIAAVGMIIGGVALAARDWWRGRQKSSEERRPSAPEAPRGTVGIHLGGRGEGNEISGNTIIGADIGIWAPDQRGTRIDGNEIKSRRSHSEAGRLEDDAAESNIFIGAGGKRIGENGDPVAIGLRVFRIPFYITSTTPITSVAALIEITKGTDTPVRGHGRWTGLGNPTQAEIASGPPAMGLARSIDFPPGPQRRPLEVLVQEQPETRLVPGWHLAKDPRTWALTELVGMQEGDYKLRIVLTGKDFEQEFVYDLTVPPDDAGEPTVARRQA